MYEGDYRQGDTVYFCWTTNDSDGAAADRSADGTISVYKDNGTTPSTAGVTDTGGSGGGFASVTGLNNCAIALTNTFYAAGHDYSVVLETATIDSQTVTALLATFSIGNRNIPSGGRYHFR